MRILVVDDAAVVRAALVHFAEAGGHVVTEATDADNGLAMAERHAPDVVVVDGRLPPDGAPAFVTRLRARGFAAAIVVVAALDERRLARAAVAAGAAGVLLRPILPSGLAKALADAGCIADG